MIKLLSPGRVILSLLLLGAGLAIAWTNLSWLVVNPPLTFDIQQEGGTIHYQVSQTHLKPGDCVTFEWQLEGISAVSFQDQGVVGADKRLVCVPSDAKQAPAMPLKVRFQNQVEITYAPQYIFHTDTYFALPLALVVIAIVLLIAPIETSALYSYLRSAAAVCVPVTLGLITAVVALFALGGLTTLQPVDRFINEPWYTLLDSSRCGYYEVSPYSTQPERVLFDQLEQVDNAEGHILVFGTSNAVESLLPYDLSPYEQSHILNLAMGASTPLEYDTVLEYLDQNKNLLHPQKGKTALVLAFWSAVFAKNPWHYIYQSDFRLYQRFNLFEESTVNWELSPTNDPIAPVIMAQARTTALLSRHLPLTIRRILFPDSERQRISDSPSNCRPLNADPATLQRIDFWRDYHGGDSYFLPNEATIPLERMAERAKEAGVPIVVINLPLPTWLHETVFQKQYLDYMEDFSRRYQAPIYDLTQLLGDEDFRDTAHPTINGRHILTKAMVDIFAKEDLLSAKSS